MAKAPTKKAKAKKGFEETLWDTANQLRGSVESSEYKHVVLSLVFLKFISDKFEARRKNWLHGLRVVTASWKNMKTRQASAKLRPCKILKITTTF